MTITKEVLEGCLADLTRQHEATLSALRAVEGAMHQTQWLLAKLEEPDAQTATTSATTSAS